MKKSNKVYLEDILNCIGKVNVYIQDLSFDEFCNDTLIQDAVIKNLEVIGEAANRLSADFIAANPDFPSKESVSMRNFLIHDYDAVDLDTLWKTIKADLPLLEKKIKNLGGSV